MRFIKKHRLILIPLSVFSFGALAATNANYRGYEQLPTSFGCSSYPSYQADGRCAEGTYTTFAGNDYVYVYTCPAGNDIVVGPDTKEVDKKWSSSQGKWITVTHPIYQCVPVEECEELSHEPGGMVDEALCGSCSAGYILTPGVYAPGAGSPVSTGFECMRNREPGECAANGMSEVQSGDGAFCVSECADGMLNGVCLPPPEPENECNKDSPDYRGVVVQGYGKPVIPACGDFDQCADGSPGKVGLVNGELRCIADNYGEQNECAADEIFVIDEFGVICAGLDDTPEEQPTPEDPNTDTDGDGQPDEYNPDNDPNINRKQLDDLKKSQEQANKSLGNLEKIGKGTNDRLDSIAKELENNSKGVGELVGLTQQINDKLDISDNATGPNLPEEGTITASLDRMNTAIFAHPTIDMFTTIPQLPSVTTCPVYTIPATKWTEPLTIDMHCVILEENRSILSLIMVAVWSLTAIAVFLRA